MIIYISGNAPATAIVAWRRPAELRVSEVQRLSCVAVLLWVNYLLVSCCSLFFCRRRALRVGLIVMAFVFCHCAASLPVKKIGGKLGEAHHTAHSYSSFSDRLDVEWLHERTFWGGIVVRMKSKSSPCPVLRVLGERKTTHRTPIHIFPECPDVKMVTWESFLRGNCGKNEVKVIPMSRVENVRVL